MERADLRRSLSRPLLLAGLVFLLLSVVTALKRGDFAGNFVEVEGTVAEIVSLKGPSGAPAYARVLQFKDELGRVWRIRSPASPKRPEEPEGSRIVLRYPPGNPGAAERLADRRGWGSQALGATAGVLLIGLSLLVRGRRRPRRPPPAPPRESR